MGFLGVLEDKHLQHVPATVILAEEEDHRTEATAGLKHGTGKDADIILIPQPYVAARAFICPTAITDVSQFVRSQRSTELVFREEDYHHGHRLVWLCPLRRRSRTSSFASSCHYRIGLQRRSRRHHGHLGVHASGDSSVGAICFGLFAKMGEASAPHCLQYLWLGRDYNWERYV